MTKKRICYWCGGELEIRKMIHSFDGITFIDMGTYSFCKLCKRDNEDDKGVSYDKKRI